MISENRLKKLLEQAKENRNIAIKLKNNADMYIFEGKILILKELINEVVKK